MATVLAPRVYGLDAICAAALAAGGEEAAHFARRLYARVADKDLAGASADQRAGAAVSLLAFARRRLPGVAKVRVFNTTADHGFESRHTIVQIVNDDMPFLVDSIANEFNRREIDVHLLAHPVLAVRRDLDGDLLGFAVEAGERAKSESMMHIEIDRQADPALLDELAAALTRVLAEVRLAVEDWRAMRRRLPRRHRRSRRQPLAQPRRVRRFPALAGGQPFHLPRPSPLSLRRGHRRRPAACATRSCRARRSASCAATRCGCSRPGWAAARRCRASPAGRATS